MNAGCMKKFHVVPAVTRKYGVAMLLMLAMVLLPNRVPIAWLVEEAVAAEETVHINGSLTYLVRISLPGDARAVVEIREGTENGRLLAETRIELNGRQVPIPFDVNFEKGKVDPAREYRLRAAIHVGGVPRWTSEAVPVNLAAGSTDLGEILLEPFAPEPFATRYQCGDRQISVSPIGNSMQLRVGEEVFILDNVVSASGAKYEAETDPTVVFWSKGNKALLEFRGRSYPECIAIATDGAEGAAASAALLAGTEWIFEDIDGHGIVGNSRVSLRFTEEDRVSGLGSCNTYTGAWTMTGAGLSIGKIAVTLRACVPAVMQQEVRFFKLLAAIKRFSIAADGALVLLTDDGRKLVARR
jgi:heat shock protein HslJ/uncharacterized lipoprotein YbaY